MGFQIENGILIKYTEEAGVKTVRIPDGVTGIGDGAFHDCSSLTGVTIPESVTDIGRGAFFRCSSLAEVTIPGSVMSIGTGAFRFCFSLSRVTIANSKTRIGEGVFWRCRALADQQGFVIVGGRLFDYYPPFDSDAYRQEKIHVVIPDGVTGIDSDAFRGCSSMSSVKIPAGVTRIGPGAFYVCSNLTSLIIPEGVTSIGEMAFMNCGRLASVTIPASVTSIGRGAFRDCRNLKDVAIGAQTLMLCREPEIWQCVIRETASGAKPAALLAAAMEKCPQELREEAEAAVAAPGTGPASC